jgi:selenocysteine lyase/cysteine desulfurase
VVLKSIRDDFPMLSEWNHFNCGGMAPLSKSVGAELLRVPTAVANEGPLKLLAHDESFLGIETARATVARFIGADPDEIAFTTQFSTGVNIVIEGMPWREGDEIIVTDQEHPALLIPLANVARRHGCVLKRIPVDDDPAVMLRSLGELLTDRTRLVAVSHVTTDSGTVLPAEEISRLAHERGSLVLFDGAHSIGQFPVDVHAIGCDFYAIVGYKWVLGPYPSAALYIRADRLDDVEVTWSGSGATTGGSVTMGVEDLNWIPGARRFEYGGRTFSYDTAMATGVAYVDGLGVEAVREHQRELVSYAHQGLDRIAGARVRSPKPPFETTGILTIELENLGGTDVSAALRERWKIITRPALRASSVRVSLAPYTALDDVDLLLEAFGTLSRE